MARKSAQIHIDIVNIVSDFINTNFDDYISIAVSDSVLRITRNKSNLYNYLCFNDNCFVIDREIMHCSSPTFFDDLKAMLDKCFCTLSF